MTEKSLALYKQVPVRVGEIGSDKIKIHLPDGKSKKVRPKDILVIHPGPVDSTANMEAPSADPSEAWELLQGESPSLQELAELVYGDFSPRTAWGAFLLLNRSPWFRGTPDAIEVRTPDEVEQIQKTEREKKEAELRWNSFIEELKKGNISEDDRGFLTDLEQYALQKSKRSRIMQDLGKQQSPENAHRLLLKLGVWDDRKNPWPDRFDMPGSAPDFALEEGVKVPGEDLCGMASYAIDDEGNKDPDDAVSFQDGWMWVHIADSSSLIPPGSRADSEARGRAANLYLPEGVVPMLPSLATERLGLGLQEISPALSFGFKIDDSYDICDFRMTFSQVKVIRMTYREAQEKMEEEPFNTLKKITDRFRENRLKEGALSLVLPEVKIRLDEEGTVCISPLEEFSSRDMVAEAMMMTGTFTARFARDNNIPIPYVIQPPPEGDLPVTEPGNLASMFQMRRFMKRSQVTTVPGPHSGMGLPVYTRATSPLRRYSDLLVQQQIRQYLAGQPLLTEEDILEGTASCESVAGKVINSERFSNLHWKLVFLKENPQWTGEAVVVGRGDKQTILSIPSLALETRIALKEKPPLNTVLQVQVEKVNIPEQQVIFKTFS